MGNKILGTDIAGIVNRALGKKLLPLTLTVKTQGSRTAGSLTSGPAITETTHTGRGILSDYLDSQLDGTIIRKGDRRVLVLGDSISPAVVPTTNDEVTIEGSKYTIVKVARDPDAAAYEMQVRD